MKKDWSLIGIEVALFLVANIFLYSQFTNQYYMVTEIEIQDSVMKTLKKYGYEKRVSTYDVKRIAHSLYIGQREFDIDYRIVLSLMKIESDYYIYAQCYNNHGQGKITIDYGLTQINSEYWQQLSKRTQEVLKRNNIHATNSYYSIEYNVMNCFVHLNSSRESLKRIGKFNNERWVQSYNCGVTGSTIEQEYWKSRRNKYYTKYQDAYAIICSL